MVIKFIMKQHLVCAQWKKRTATGKTVIFKGCHKQVGREDLSGLGLDLSLLIFFVADEETSLGRNKVPLSQVRN